MKFLLFFFVIGYIPLAHSQEISYNTSSFAGGYNVSCHGSTDGWINIVVVGGHPPYLYTWSNGSFNQNLSNIGAGTYTVTVTDINSDTASIEIVIKQPNQLGLTLMPKLYEGGYNISSLGGNDGEISTSVNGGSLPYSYLWSNGGDKDKVEQLIAGSYSLILTDMNGCTISSSTVLTEPSELRIVSITSPEYNGYNLPCHGGENGIINLTVAGGALPYTYQWSNGQFEEDLTGLSKGIFWVIVRDANDNAVAQQINLTEPPDLHITALTPSIYSNGSNISCYGCSNGSITSTVSGGISPYTYYWESGQTTSSIQGLSKGQYYLFVTDANGCNTKSDIGISGPEREDWSLTGNSGLSPVQYLGTSDSSDIVIKTNNLERVRITKSGKIGIGTATIPTDYAFAVNGKIICEELKVKLRTAWPDYVFANGYPLLSIDELKRYIAINHHLPGIPSADEVTADGISVSETLNSLLQKIEMLTLYLIEQQEQIEQLKKANK
jgi:hypothetical protein